MSRLTHQALRHSALLACALLTACSATPSTPLYQQLTAEDSRIADNAARVALETLPSGQTQSWFNPSTGSRGEVTPGATWYLEARGQYCRAYQERIFIGQKSARYEDVACRNARGVWVAYP